MAFISESLRKYPPASNLARVTKHDYCVPGSKHVIERGCRVWIPVYGIHHDPEYYPDPDRFDPDRFTADKVAKRESVLWLPFGDGPRNCIGLRFGMMQTRVGLIALLNDFEFEPCDRTNIPLSFLNHAPILTPKGGMWLKAKKVS